MFSYFADALNVKSIGEILAPTLTPEAQLHAAIEDGLMDKVRHLIEQDQVDPNARNTVGSLPIHTAAYHGQIAIVEYLVHEHQVDLKVPGPRGNTTLHLAASRGHFELVQLLIKSGAHPATQNESKRTAYDVAKGDSLRQYLLPLVFQHEDPSLKAANLPPGITPTADPNAVKAPLAPPPTTMSNGSVYAPAAVLLPNRSMVTSNSRGSKSDPKVSQAHIHIIVRVFISYSYIYQYLYIFTYIHTFIFSYIHIFIFSYSDLSYIHTFTHSYFYTFTHSYSDLSSDSSGWLWF